jgi:lipoprotein-anchoring transpeptidase ErfK/SrfK
MQSPSLHVSIRSQTLIVRGLPAGGKKWRRYRISTSRYGLGTEPGSYKTPLGRFAIARKIGAGAPLGSVFKSRVATGEIGNSSNPEDLIQTRILWLKGLDAENANSMERYIYIHGTNHEEDIGMPASHGCVRMRNRDVAELYAMVRKGTPVFIQP